MVRTTGFIRLQDRSNEKRVVKAAPVSPKKFFRWDVSNVIWDIFLELTLTHRGMHITFLCPIAFRSNSPVLRRKKSSVLTPARFYGDRLPQKTRGNRHPLSYIDQRDVALV